MFFSPNSCVLLHLHGIRAASCSSKCFLIEKSLLWFVLFDRFDLFTNDHPQIFDFLDFFLIRMIGLIHQSFYLKSPDFSINFLSQIDWFIFLIFFFSTMVNTEGNRSNSDPLSVTNIDKPGSKLVTVLFDATKFQRWSRAIKISLTAKMKLGFIDGTCKSLIQLLQILRNGKEQITQFLAGSWIAWHQICLMPSYMWILHGNYGRSCGSVLDRVIVLWFFKLKRTF